MPAVSVNLRPQQGNGKGLTKPKSKLRLRLGLTPPHPTAAKAVSPTPVPSLPVSHQPAPIPAVTSNLLATSTSTNRTSISRVDSRSAFTYDTSPSNTSQHDNETPSPAFEDISLVSHSPNPYPGDNVNPMMYPEANISRSTIASNATGMDPALARQYYYPTPERTEPEVEDDAGLQHPCLQKAISQSDDIFLMTDKQLKERFDFGHEIGFGNWGSVWVGKPRHYRASTLEERIPGGKMGRMAAANGGYGAGGKVAFKLITRQKTAVTAARVRALWGEMKIIRSLRSEPHPSVITFEAFIITESLAMVVMPYLSHLIPVCLSPERAITYFRQLCSAVGYLHERGITHNDIKPANVMLSHSDVPTLVDFGFANKWPLGERSSFFSNITWGTPEYLDPIRAKGQPHDERASDVWSLGITLYEILIGRTPFEENEEEEFHDPDSYLIYYERSRQGEWLGDWSIPYDLEHLIRSMVCPDPAYRITAMQAYHHPALQLPAPTVIITPHFVREAATFDEDEQPPIPYHDQVPYQPQPRAPAHAQVHGQANLPKKKKKVPKTKEAGPRSATPTALGESIRQHTSNVKPAPIAGKGGKGKGREVDEEGNPKKGSKLVIKNTREQRYSDKRAIEEDITPTKVVKPAQPLKIKEPAVVASAPVQGVKPLRTSESQSTIIPESRHRSTILETTVDSARNSVQSSTGMGAKSHEEAILKTMSSLEGKRLRKTTSSRDILGKITRPAPKPPVEDDMEGDRPVSTPAEVDAGVEAWRAAVPKVDVMDQVKEVEEKSVEIEQGENPSDEMRISKVQVKVTLSPARPKPAPATKRESIASPPRQRRGVTPGDIVHAEELEAEEEARKRSFEIQQDLPHVVLSTTSTGAGETSPLAELRQRILDTDHQVQLFKKNSVDLMRPSIENYSGSEKITGTPIIASLSRTKSIEALAMSSKLDKLSEWVRGIDSIIVEAKKALAEGREPPLPLLAIPTELAGHPAVQEIQHQFGLTPNGKSAIPAHLRTSSTQVEPATPPRWMTYAEAEETVKKANEGPWRNSMTEEVPAVYGKKVKKERPTVSHMMKLFGQDYKRESGGMSEPATVPLKPPALRGVPSTPALRASTTRNVPQRKSESNFRGSRQFNTMPTVHSTSPTTAANPDTHPYAQGAGSQSPPASSHPFAVKQRGVYEQLLDQNPAVARQGEGWASRNNVNLLSAPHPSFGRSMGKTSSMMSLREKAKAFLNGDKEKEKAVEKDKRETLDLTTFAPEDDNYHPNRGSRRESKGNGVRWSESTTNFQNATISQATRPGTPGALSTLSMSTNTITAPKKKGLFSHFKWGNKKEDA